MEKPGKYRGKRTKIGPKKKIALVCSGGGSKAGAFHLGVALALQEHGFKFLGGPVEKSPDGDPIPHIPEPMEISTYIGSSAGSLISSYLASGYSLTEIFNSFMNKKGSGRELPILTYTKMFKLRPELAREQIKQVFVMRKMLSNLVDGNWGTFLQFKWIKAKGLFSTGGIEKYLREEVLTSNNFSDYRADLFIVATQLNHSRKVVFGKYKYKPPADDLQCEFNNSALISEACAASTALPFFFAPYAIEMEKNKKTHFIDGEIRDTLSTHVAADAGADLVIASYTHQPYHYNREMGSLTERGLPEIIVQSIYLLVEQKINKHISNKQSHRNAIDAVLRYCKQQGISDEHTKKIIGILESELHERRDIDTIYIHPRATDTAMFMRPHFSLAPDKLSDIARSGFKAGIEILRKYDFEDRNLDPPINLAKESTSAP